MPENTELGLFSNTNRCSIHLSSGELFTLEINNLHTIDDLLREIECYCGIKEVDRHKFGLAHFDERYKYVFCQCFCFVRAIIAGIMYLIYAEDFTHYLRYRGHTYWAEGGEKLSEFFSKFCQGRCNGSKLNEEIHMFYITK